MPNEPLTVGRVPGSEEDLIHQASLIEANENVRYTEARGVLETAHRQFREAMNDGFDEQAHYTEALDNVGAQNKRAISGIRRSLGARGLNPNSGAAQGILSRLIMSNRGQLIADRRRGREIARRERQANEATSFANALNLAGLINSPVSGAMLETSQNIFEGNLVREGLDVQREANDSAKDANFLEIALGAIPIIGDILPF